MAVVVRCGDIDLRHLGNVLEPYGLTVQSVDSNKPIPGSYWGDAEAGLIDDVLYVRDDTPIHSALHEACHYICMDGSRRKALHTDAGGDYAEENGVCYLQILLAAPIASMGSERMLTDMDAWGYTFRLGSARAWFENDAEDARQWLVDHGILDQDNRITWQCRP